MQIILALYLVSVGIKGLSGSSLSIRRSCQSLCGLGSLVYRISFMTSYASNGDLKASRSEYQILFEEKEMKVSIADLHPTQLYLSEKKLQIFRCFYQSAETIQVDQSVFLPLEIAC